jgi:glyoxylase-like metal-dependent hydrolase (beta-lactamase superfamily II)
MWRQIAEITRITAYQTSATATVERAHGGCCSKVALVPKVPKQEQEEAKPEVTEVAPGILRMQLPIMFTGLGHVNMYGLVDERGIAVVDPGLPGGSSWKAISDRLNRAGFKVGDVHSVIVTHSHPDHFGGAGRLAKQADAEIVTHAAFGVPWLPETMPDVATFEDGIAEDEEVAAEVADQATDSPGGPVSPAERERFRRLKPWSPELFRPPLRDRLKVRAFRIGRKMFTPPVPTRRLHDGEHIKFAGREWFALHTPGHTADHLCLHDPEEGVLLTGDHVLPSITPHVAGVGAGPDPLDDYVAALDRVKGIADLKIALPAHGHPFHDVAGRVDAIKRHHKERLEQLSQIAAGIGHATVKEFAHQLFPAHHWGLMAESETYAHLEHLRHAGRARSHRRPDGELVYDVD